MANQNIQFSVQNRPDFINELRAKVKDYFDNRHTSKYANATMILKSVIMYSLYLIPYFILISGIVNSVPAVFICYILMGFGVAGVGMSVMHDANHGTYSKKKSINRLWSYSLYTLGGFPPTWQHQHNTLHNGFTNIDGHDEDITPPGVLRFSPHGTHRKFHRYQHLYAWFFYGLMTLLWSTIKDFKQLRRYRKSGAVLAGNSSFRKMYIKVILSKILYYLAFLTIPLMVLPVPWYWVVLPFLTMHFISGIILATVFQTAHVVTNTEYLLPDENGNMENNWAIHQMLSTSDYSPNSKMLSWYIGGLNYQIEHHLFPNICHVHYKKISLLVRSTALKYGLPYHVQPTFYSAIVSHIKMLKILGQK